MTKVAPKFGLSDVGLAKVEMTVFGRSLKR